MSTVDQLFDPIILHEAEEKVLSDIYTHPVVVKHLKAMALNETKELISLSTVNQDAVIAKALAKVQGRLDVLATLLSIAVVSNQTKESQ